MRSYIQRSCSRPGSVRASPIALPAESGLAFGPNRRPPVYKIRIPAVPLGHHAVGGGPGDAERRIVPPHTPFGSGNVKLGHLVEDLRVVLQRLESVRDAF